MGFMPWNLNQSFQYHFGKQHVSSRMQDHLYFSAACCLAQTSPRICELRVMTHTVQLYTCQTHLFTDGNDFSVLGHSEEQPPTLWLFVGCWFRRGEKTKATGENQEAKKETRSLPEPALEGGLEEKPGVQPAFSLMQLQGVTYKHILTRARWNPSCEE